MVVYQPRQDLWPYLDYTWSVQPRPEVEDEEVEGHTYVGATHDFKERFYRHRTSFNNEDYRTDTTLSRFVWKLKEARRDFDIRWRIIDRGAAYRPSAKRCNLCLKEKYWIIFHPEMASLKPVLQKVLQCPVCQVYSAAFSDQ